MELRFSIEAKSFCFLTKDGSSLFRLEEKRKKFVGYIFVSPQCSSWLIDMVEAACLVKENITKSFREGDKALMVHGGDNKVGRLLEVAVVAEGGRRQLVAPGGVRWVGLVAFCGRVAHFVGPLPMVVRWSLRFALRRV